MTSSNNLSNLSGTLTEFRQATSETAKHKAEKRLRNILFANADSLLYLYEKNYKPPVLTEVLTDGSEFCRAIQRYMYRCSLIVRQTDIAREMPCSTSYVNNLVYRLPLRCKLVVIERFLVAVRNVLGPHANLVVDPSEFVHSIRYHVQLAIAGIPLKDLAKHCQKSVSPILSVNTIERTLEIPDLMTMYRAQCLIDGARHYHAAKAKAASRKKVLA